MKLNFPLITITILLVFTPFLVKAYPNNAKTIPFIITGKQTITLLNATDTARTILNATILNYAHSPSEGSFIDCGNVRLAKAYYWEGQDDREMSYLCSDIIIAGSSGDTNAYGQIVYVDYDLSLTGSFISDASGSSFFLDKSWDYGELFIAFLLILQLFLTIFLIVFSFFFEPVFKIRGKQ
jgi:hypothetical protein